jgi:hypothetical protein
MRPSFIHSIINAQDIFRPATRSGTSGKEVTYDVLSGIAMLIRLQNTGESAFLE